MAVQRLRAGVAEAEITPKPGVQLACELAPRTAKGVKAPLLARACVLSNGEAELAIVTLDLYGLQKDTADEIVAATAERCGLAPEAVLLICSRTRGAPYTTPVVGRAEVDSAYIKDVAGKVPGVVADAQKAMQEASLGLGQAVLPHLIYNHRLMTRNMKAISAWMGVPPDEVLYPEGPTDPELAVFVLRDDKGFPFCLLWSLAADNRFCSGDQISPDLPGLVQQAVDARIGRHVPCLYLSGCGGNVSYQHGLEAAADAVASGVMAVQLETPCDPLVRLGAAWEKMILPIRDYSRFWSQADVELKCPDGVQAFGQEVELMQKEGALAVSTVVHVLRLGQFGLVGLPGAPFVEFALDIKQQSPFLKTVVAGNAHHDAGWVITRQAFMDEGFEAWPARSAPIGPGGGEFMAEEAVTLLKRLWS